MKLNLGCGLHKMSGYVNVDKAGDPDVRHDLEQFPWPWDDSVFETVQANHVLEHLGRDPETFIGVVKELYRVCRHGATVQINVPHPRNDDFLSDPTHVRPITPPLMQLFSRRLNLEWQAQQAANSPLALYHNVDFELRVIKLVLEEPYRSEFDAGRLTQQELKRITRKYNNVVREIRMTLDVVKA